MKTSPIFRDAPTKFNDLFRLLLWTCCLFLPTLATAQISGTVFRDFNGNGTQESAEPLVAGVLVKAYGTSGTQCGTTQTTTAASAPNYSLSGCTGAVRVEFELPAGACFVDNGKDYAALGGSTYGSSVQFLANTSAATRTANFAVYYPVEYGGTTSFEPKLYNVIQRAGDPVPSPAAPLGDNSYTANQASVVATDYLADGHTFTPSENWFAVPDAQRQIGVTPLALARQTGSLWGVSYSKPASRLFVSAFLRRHAGMGPGGPGAIYMINPASPDLTGNLLFASLDDLGFPTHAASGAFHIRNNATRNLIAQPNYTPSTDAFAYEQVAKTSLGDLDISEDGQYLFTVNLYDRKIYRIDLQNAAAPVAPTVAQVSSYLIPDPCSGITDAGDYRPFALKAHRGKLYVGIVCSGQTTADPAPPDWRNTGMRLFITAYDLGTNNTPSSPTTVYNQGVTYRDADELQASGNPPSGYGSARWKPWTTTFTTGDQHPLFTDIEFDNSGNFLMGLTDRNAYQTGGGNNDLNGNAPFTKAYANGDVIKLVKNTSCNLTPATGIYYQNDFYQDQARWGIPYTNGNDPYTHAEITLGGITVHHAGDRDEVVSTALNPVVWTSNGYVAFNNDNGQQVRANELWYDNCDPNTQACFWKAGGVGDLEVLSLPSPIEIGNRVWLDVDNDGIQDAGEAGISGVQVQLIKSGTTIATATTDASGNYYFSSAAGTSTASTKYGIAQLVPNMAYTVHFPTTATVSGTTYNLTTAAAGSNRLIDSNAPANGDVTILATDIPLEGANNHSFDVGYSSPPVCTPPTGITAVATPPTCSGTTVQSNGMITLTGTLTGLRYQYSAGLVFNSSTAVPASPTAIPAGGVIASNLPNPVATGEQPYTIRIYPGSDNSCYTDLRVNLIQTSCVNPGECLLHSSYLGNTILGYDGSLVSQGSSNNSGCSLSGPYDMTWGPDGKIYVTSSLSNEVYQYDANANCQGTLVTAGAGGLSDPRGLTFMPDGTLLVTSLATGKILRYNGTTGAYIGVFSNGSDITPAPASMGPHQGIVLGPDGALWVTDYTNSRVLRFNATTGAFLSVFTQHTAGSGARSILFGADGYVYISYRDSKQVIRYKLDGTMVGVVADATDGLNGTTGIVWGPDGYIYINNVENDLTVILNPATDTVVNTLSTNTPKDILFKNGSCFAPPMCSLSVTATPGACNSATNTYNVTGQFTFANAPTSGTLSATIGASSSTPITMTGTTTSPQSYTITGLTADGASHTVNASFSASPTCTGTVNYTAPNSCTVTGQPDLHLTKTSSVGSVTSGQTFSYTITLTNNGTLAATGVQVRDLLPASLTYVSSTASQGSYNNTTGIWTVGTVAIGASLTLTINVTVN